MHAYLPEARPRQGSVCASTKAEETYHHSGTKNKAQSAADLGRNRNAHGEGRGRGHTFAVARHKLRVDVRLLSERARQVQADRLAEVQQSVRDLRDSQDQYEGSASAVEEKHTVAVIEAKLRP